MVFLVTSKCSDIEDKDPLSGTDEVSGDVVEVGFFHADCCV